MRHVSLVLFAVACSSSTEPAAVTGSTPDAAAVPSADAGAPTADAAAVAMPDAPGPGPADAGALPADETLIITAVGAAKGAARTETIGPAGGAASEATTGASISVPAGTFGVATVVTLQPVVNTMEDGLGDGIAISAGEEQRKPFIVRMLHRAEAQGRRRRPAPRGRGRQHADLRDDRAGQHPGV